MPEPAPATFLAWLRARGDDELSRLLDRRPDLALPPPLDFGSLAGRAGVRMSVQRALEQLTTFELRVLDALRLVPPPGAPESLAEIIGAADAGPIRRALDTLMELALVWRDDDGPRPLAAVAEALGGYPAGLGRPAAELLRIAGDGVAQPIAARYGALSAPELASRYDDAQWVRDRIGESGPAARAVLAALAQGPPLGRVPDAHGSAARRPADPPTPDDAPSADLIARGLLLPVDAASVELPREVGLALRGGRAWTSSSPEPPPIALRDDRSAARDVDAAASVEAQAALRLIEDLADRWSANPPTSLRAGGIGVRDLRRTAKDLGLDEPAAAVLIETAAAAGLIGPSAAMPPVWLLTAGYDDWIERDAPQRWLELARAWLDMPRRPGLIGAPGARERTVAALSPDAGRTTMPALRRQVLEVLASAPAGAAVADRESVLARLMWLAPRRDAERRDQADEALREAALLGITGAGGLSGFARALLDDDAPGAAQLLSDALPAAVAEFLVQPDLTVVVPGPPDPELGRTLRLIADLESSGGAYVFRISEATLRRALDAGRSAEDLRGFLGDRSRTPIPQALSYLIDDAARRHGSLRAGAVSSYLRSEDPALLDQVSADRRLGGRGLHRLSATVAVSDLAVGELLRLLRDAGFAPMPEDGDGLIIAAGPEPVRAPQRRAPGRVTTRRTSAAELAAAVARLRSSDAILSGAPATPAGGPSIPGVTSARTLELLRAAVVGGRTVGLAVAESEGTVVARMLEPISLGGGHVRGYDPRSPDRLTSYPLHRITSVLDLGPVEAAMADGAPALDGGGEWEDDPGD